MKPSSTPSRRSKRYVRLPLPVLKFLLGIAPLEGVWFGEEHPKRRGKFWWRSAYFLKYYERIDAVKSEHKFHAYP